MKWQTKPNQFTITKGEPVIKVKKIKAIYIDVNKKTIELTEIDNSLTDFQKINEFEDYKKKCLYGMEYLFTGIYEDLKGKGNNSFRMKGDDEDYFGDAIIVKMPKSMHEDKLRSTEINVEIIRKYIKFSD